MSGISNFIIRLSLLSLILCTLPLIASAEIHDVTIQDSYFSPNSLVIAAGDTVRWTYVGTGEGGCGPYAGCTGAASHTVTADDGSFSSNAPSSDFTFEHQFSALGEYRYYCGQHSQPGRDINSNMNGLITVASAAPAFPMNAGHNGSWWNGPQRSGEGVQVELSDGGEGSILIVVTIYSYDTLGQQIFMIAIGNVDGDTAELDVFITDGGLWGDDFDPTLVNETQWGSGAITSTSCESMQMELIPNAEYLAMGYSDLTYSLVRLTTPLIPCPMN